MIAQGVWVYEKNGVTVALGKITGEELWKHADAATVLQSALSAAGEAGGGEVELQPGVFRLQEPLRLPSRTTLRGSGRGTRLVVDAADGEGVGVLAQGAKGAVVRDLAIHAGAEGTQRAGAVFDDCGDCQMIDVYAQDFAGCGLVVRNNSFLCEVRGCKLANNGEAGLRLEQLADKGRVGDYIPNLVTNCIAYGGGHGFQTIRCIVANFVACQAFQVNRCGFRIEGVSNSVLLSGCRTFKIVGDAVSVEASHEFNATGNIFCWHRGRGIVLRDVSWACISGNEIIDSGSEMTGGDAAIGVLLAGKTEAVQITGNTIFNWGGQGLMTYGVREEATCRNNAIVANNFNWWDRADIFAEGENTRVENNTGRQSPAYHGSPEGPDPRFNLDAMMAFLRE
jgi:hypothetical protein